jgi:hypothetical protein
LPVQTRINRRRTSLQSKRTFIIHHLLLITSLHQFKHCRQKRPLLLCSYHWVESVISRLHSTAQTEREKERAREREGERDRRLQRPLPPRRVPGRPPARMPGRPMHLCLCPAKSQVLPPSPPSLLRRARAARRRGSRLCCTNGRNREGSRYTTAPPAVRPLQSR